MRVLHIDSGTDMRGGQWQCLHLVSALGADSVLLTPAGSPLAGSAIERGVEVQPLNFARVAMLARSFDVVHAHDARSHTWAVAVGAQPVIVSRRVAFPVHQTPISRWKYARPAHYIAVSECVKTVLVTAGVSTDKISVVYDGVALPEGTAHPERIVALETEDPMKGSALLRAAAGERFEIRFSNALERDLPGATLFVYVTHSEGLGSAALLAMAWGVPVVASRIGGLPEIVEDRKTGVLTDNDPASIAAAIEWALAHRDELAANARAAVASRFTIDNMVEGTRAVYRKVLAC